MAIQDVANAVWDHLHSESYDGPELPLDASRQGVIDFYHCSKWDSANFVITSDVVRNIAVTYAGCALRMAQSDASWLARNLAIRLKHATDADLIFAANTLREMRRNRKAKTAQRAN